MKKIGRIVGYLTLVAIGAAGIVLIMAHAQVRAVAPDLPTKDALLALRTDAGPTRVSFFTTSSQQLAHGMISHNSIVVEWPNGDLFLIDTGMDRDGAIAFGELLGVIGDVQEPPIFNGTVADILGKDVDRVSGVGFTHLHIDHIQGLKDFCKVRGQGALGLQTSSQITEHNFNTSEGAEIIASSCLEVVELPGDGLATSDSFPGLGAFQLGGHTPGSTLWAVALGERVLLFSGDITNTKADLDQDKPKASLYSYVLVPENTNRTAQLRQWLRQLDQQEEFSVSVSHDVHETEVLQRWPEVSGEW